MGSRLQDDLVALRRGLHRRPEVGLHLPETQRAVLDALDGLELAITTGGTCSSVTAVLRGAHDGPAVLLRGDMDALPLTEATGLDYASEIDGAMHACGHDLHVAMLVGAARLLCERRDELHGDVVLMFQPGEEGFDGAAHMIAEGVLDAAGRRVSAAFGMHVGALQASGLFSSRPGPLMAASDAVTVAVRGAGGHGSAPHLARDPITAAAELVTAIQTMVTRRFDVFDPVVVTVGTLHAGTRHNIVPDTATLGATVRTFSAANRARVRTELIQLCEHVAAAHGLVAEVGYHPEYPATVNDPDRYSFARTVVRDVLGADRFALEPTPVMASEDFSRVLREVPGCYLFLGAATSPDAAADNHSPQATFDDAVLADGALVHAELAIRALRES